MRKFRIIPRLDIKGPNLVKGIHLEGLRVLGDPASFARYYYEQGADELFYQDVVASLYGRSSLHDIISRTAKESFIPLTVGGGIRSISDISEVLKAGADKISINTGAVKDPAFIKKAAEKFGRSTIVIAIEAIKQPDGRYLAFTDNAREETELEVTEWACRVAELGAGELILTSVDREGTGSGLDEKLINQIVKKVNIPVIAHGGINSAKDVYKAFELNCSGVAIASAFHYDALDQGIVSKPTSKEEGNTRFLDIGNAQTRVKSFSITNLKYELQKLNVPVRGI